MTNIIKCRFLDKDGEPRGREYSYKTEIPVEVGQIVDVPAPRQSDADSELKTKSVIVSQINVPEEEIATFADKVKTVVFIRKMKRRINKMHTTEQRREIFKSCEKEMLFLHEIMGNKNMSEILRPMIKEKFMDMNYKMAEMYMEDIGEVIQLLPRYAVPSVIATLKLILEALEKDMTEKDKMVAQEIKERGAVAIIRHKIK